MKDYKLSVTKSLFPPFRVYIDGEVYESRPLTAELFEELDRIEKEAGSPFEVGPRELNLIFGIPIEVAKKLDLRVVQAIIRDISRAVITGALPEQPQEPQEIIPRAQKKR